MQKETSVTIGSITFHLRFEKEPDQVSIVKAASIADRLRAEVDPLTDAIRKEGAELIIYYQEDGSCRLVMDGPKELQEKIRELVGPDEI